MRRRRVRWGQGVVRSDRCVQSRVWACQRGWDGGARLLVAGRAHPW